MGKVNDSLMYLLDTKKCIKNAIIRKGATVSDSTTFREYADIIDLFPSDIEIQTALKEVLKDPEVSGLSSELIANIKEIKKQIQDAIVWKGVTVEDDDPFNIYPEKIKEIKTDTPPPTPPVDLTGGAPVKDFSFCRQILTEDQESSYKYKVIFLTYIPKAINMAIKGNREMSLKTCDGSTYIFDDETKITHKWNESVCPGSLHYEEKKLYWYIIYANDTKDFFLDPTIAYFCIDGFSIDPKFYINNREHILGSEAINNGSIQFDPNNTYMALALRNGPLTYPDIDLKGITNASYILENQFNMLVSPKVINSENTESFKGFLSWCAKLKVVTPFDTSHAKDVSQMFMQNVELETIPPFDFSNVENIDAIFVGCEKLIEIPYLDIPKVKTTPSQMFMMCKSLKRINGINLIGLQSIAMLFFGLESLEYVKLDNTQNIEDFSSLFHTCKNLKVVEGLDMKSAKTTIGIFAGCTSIESMDTIPIKNIDMIDNFSTWFFDCTSLNKIPDYPWDKAKSLTNTFGQCISLQDAITMNLSNCLNLYGCFDTCSNLSKIELLNTNQCTIFDFTFRATGITNIKNLDTSKAESMVSTFANCKNLIEEPNIDTRNVKDLDGLYSGCIGLKKIQYLDTRVATTTRKLFSDCKNIQTTPVFNMQNVTKAAEMFLNCESLLNVEMQNVGNILNASSMFNGCYSLSKVSFTDIPAPTDVSCMFSNCYSLETIPNIDFSKAIKITDIFEKCYSIKTIDSMNFSSATLGRDDGVFGDCISLENVGSINLSSTENANSLFFGCKMLKSVEEIILSSTCSSAYSVFSGCSSLVKAPQVKNLNSVDLRNFFYNCSSLKEVPEMDLNYVSNLNNMFYGCINLETVLLKNIPVSLDLSASTKFTSDSILTVFNNLKKVSTKQTLTLGATNLAKLTDEQKAIATSKGWTLA